MASTRIHPLFFGPREAPLFGCHHGPAAASAASPGVVIAPPLGHEYVRAHRALVKLAEACAGRGLRALRFDFRGTGDSAGEAWPQGQAGQDARVPPGPPDAWTAWVDDLESARRELTLRARVPSTALVGVRLAGTLALECATRHRPFEALVLWDPVLDGESFRAALAEEQRRFAASLPAGAPRADTAPGEFECLGFLWPAALLERLAAFQPPSTGRPLAERLLLLETRPTQAGAALARAQSAAGARVEHAATSGAEPWREDVDRGLVPAADLARIVEFLASASPTAAPGNVR